MPACHLACDYIQYYAVLNWGWLKKKNCGRDRSEELGEKVCYVDERVTDNIICSFLAKELKRGAGGVAGE